MSANLQIIGAGAVTAIGLTAAQTCAAFRARLSGIAEAVTLVPEVDTVLGAGVVVRSRLRERPDRWLLALAERAIRDALCASALDVGRIALFLGMPEPFRLHPGMDGIRSQDVLTALGRRFGQPFHRASCVMLGGHAAAYEGLEAAESLLSEGHVDACLIGGVDSLLNEADVMRLQAAGRLHGPDNPQGVIPGEAAALVLVRSAASGHGEALATIAAVAHDAEVDVVTGVRFSTGEGLWRALRRAHAAATCAAPDLALRISDMNGERYRAWESVIASARFYRTRPERIPGWFPASSMGDVGAASAGLCLVIGATAVARGYAPGPWVMCEGSSDEGLRGACVLKPGPGARIPPFRSQATAESGAKVA